MPRLSSPETGWLGPWRRILVHMPSYLLVLPVVIFMNIIPFINLVFLYIPCYASHCSFSSLTLGDLLSVSILDLVRSLGSTRGGFRCFSFVCLCLPFFCAVGKFFLVRFQSYNRLCDRDKLSPILQGTPPFVSHLASPEHS